MTQKIPFTIDGIKLTSKNEDLIFAPDQYGGAGYFCFALREGFYPSLEWFKAKLETNAKMLLEYGGDLYKMEIQTASYDYQYFTKIEAIVWKLGA